MKETSLCSASYVAVNATLLAFAAGAPCSNRSISPARRAHSSKRAARRAAAAQDGTDRQTDRQTDGQTDGRQFHIDPDPPTMRAVLIKLKTYSIIQINRKRQKIIFLYSRLLLLFPCYT